MTEHFGGQAVVEGIMICSKKKVAVAVRKENGSIKKKIEKRGKLAKKFKDIIFLRGLVALIEMTYLGLKALTWSSNENLEEDEKIGGWWMFFVIFLSFAIAIGLFILLPLWLSNFFSEERVMFNLVDGFWRILIFVGYLLFISRFKDVKRVFEYHGAEHAVVNCYESGKTLNIKNVKKFSTIHPRCGTSFIFIVLIISIILFSFVWSERLWLKFLYRILLIPVIAMISYEILKIGSKYDNFILNTLLKPGLWFQKITTKQPNNKQIEVGIAAFKAAK